MNTDALAALCQRVRDEHPPEIRVCCPRHGHFIVAVAVTVNWGGGDPPLMMDLAFGRDHRLRKRAILVNPTPAQLDQLDAGNPDFAMNSGPNGVTVTPACRRCGWKSQPRDYLSVAAELAVYALAGHAEHRLSG